MPHTYHINHPIILLWYYIMNTGIYDFIIIGAGPTGLTVATFLPENSTKLVIDQEETVGGCHRVTRVGPDRIVTEHGPRVYSEAYVNTKKLFKNLKIPFKFTKYNYQMLSLIGEKIPFSVSEYLTLTVSFAETVEDASVNFSAESKEFLRRLCLLTDGAEPSNYPLKKLKNLINQQLFYSLIQPEKPMDSLLFDAWKSILESEKRCTFRLRSRVSGIGTGAVSMDDGMVIRCKESVIACVAPWIFPNLYPMISFRSNVYTTYISVMFWWKDKIKIMTSEWGFPKSEWGIAYIELSDYWKDEPGTYLSTCITLPDRPSKFTGKSAIETGESSIPEEILRQLSIRVTPDFGNVYHRRDTAWVGKDYISSKTVVPGVYSVGTHNGHCKYDFTSFESAVTNGMVFCGEPVSSGFEVTDFLIYGLSVFLIVLLFQKRKSI